jgi:Phosphomannomutase
MELTEKQKYAVLADARLYLASEKDEKFADEVAKAIEMEDWENLYDRFYTQLAFGTAGMRGIIGGGTNRINPFMVRKVTQGLADYLNEESKEPSVAIAYDSRLYSADFALSAATVLAANGVKVLLYSVLHPVPMLSFALRYTHSVAGIVITASHNPSSYNGYKVYWSDGGQVTPPHDIGIAEKVGRVKSDMIRDMSEAEARAKGLLITMPEEVDEAYYAMVDSSLRRPSLVKNAPITVAYTPLHGSGNIPVRTMLSRYGIKTVVVKEQENPDGAFPTVKLPNPESAEAMERVIALAKKEKADIVLGTDPDADRLGIAIPKTPEKKDYLLLTGNQIATLLADYLLCTSKENGRKGRPLLVKSLVTTDIIARIAASHGAECKDVLTGFKYIAEQIERVEKDKGTDEFFLFGCEESYGFLTVKDVRDKDAVSSAIAAVEMMCYYASIGKTLQQRLDEIYDEYGFSTEIVFSRDYEGAAGKEKMKSIMADLRALKAGDVLVNRTLSGTLDLLGENTGFPKADVLVFSFTSGEKLIVRPSGTEPKIKYYIFLSEGNGLKREMLTSGKDRIKNEFYKSL